MNKEERPNCRRKDRLISRYTL